MKSSTRMRWLALACCAGGCAAATIHGDRAVEQVVGSPGPSSNAAWAPAPAPQSMSPALFPAVPPTGLQPKPSGILAPAAAPVNTMPVVLGPRSADILAPAGLAAPAPTVASALAPAPAPAPAPFVAPAPAPAPAAAKGYVGPSVKITFEGKAADYDKLTAAGKAAVKEAVGEQVVANSNGMIFKSEIMEIELRKGSIVAEVIFWGNVSNNESRSVATTLKAHPVVLNLTANQTTDGKPMTVASTGSESADAVPPVDGGLDTLAQEAWDIAEPGFRDLDTSPKDGVVDVNEAATFGVRNGVPWSSVKRLFDAVDADHDGKITQKEYFAQRSRARELLEDIAPTFRDLDLDHDGILSSKEWMLYCDGRDGWMEADLSKATCESLFDAADSRAPKGFVDRWEFQTAGGRCRNADAGKCSLLALVQRPRRGTFLAVRGAPRRTALRQD